MNPTHLRYLCVAMVASLMFLNGCIAPVASTPTFSSVTPLPVTTTSMPSPVPPTRTPLLTPTPQPPTPTVAPSPTIAPTLTADQEQALVLELLQTNAGCRLPCWWGFTPGQTTWPTAYAFFASVGKMPAESRGPKMLNYTVTFHIPQHDVQVRQIYIVSGNLIEAIEVEIRTVRNYETVYGDERFAEDLQRYLLPQLLTTYGQPTEVLLRTFRSVPEGSFIPFNLLLFYPQQGILVRYYGPTERKGEHIRICPQRTEIALRLWLPNKQIMTFEDIARLGILRLPLEEVSDFRSLEEATGMNLETFYETFKSPNNQLCLETPASMWP